MLSLPNRMRTLVCHAVLPGSRGLTRWQVAARVSLTGIPQSFRASLQDTNRQNDRVFAILYIVCEREGSGSAAAGVSESSGDFVRLAARREAERNPLIALQHESSDYLLQARCLFLLALPSSSWKSTCSTFDLCEDLRIPEEVVLLVADLDGLSAKAWQEDLVAGLDAHFEQLAVDVARTGANSNDRGLGKRLVGGAREEDA